MGLLLNSLKLGNKTFKIEDSKGFLDLKTLGLPENFYGGRVEHIAKTETEGIYMCIEKMKAIDIYIPDLKLLGAKELKKIADIKNIEYKKNFTTEQMLELF